jgi:hypothetical protein
MVSAMFLLWGASNTLGGFGPSASALVTMVGEKLYWLQPKAENDEDEAMSDVTLKAMVQ